MREFLIAFLVLAISYAAIGVTSLQAAGLVESDQPGQKSQSEAPTVKGGSGSTSSGEAAAVGCCKLGDTTPPTELVQQVPPGGLHSPYPDYAKMVQDNPDLVKQFRLPGCNECHGGNGGGGFCPALSQGVWFWGNTDDVLFRLITLGSAGLEKQGSLATDTAPSMPECPRWG